MIRLNCFFTLADEEKKKRLSPWPKNWSRSRERMLAALPTTSFSVAPTRSQA